MPVDLQSIAEAVPKLTPADLPPTPWVLKVAPRVPIGRSVFLGGPYVTVTNNEVWLRELQRDVAAGPCGPRGKTGAVQEDLEALAGVLAQRREA
jgi:hypothetical protein